MLFGEVELNQLKQGEWVTFYLLEHVPISTNNFVSRAHFPARFSTLGDPHARVEVSDIHENESRHPRPLTHTDIDIPLHNSKWPRSRECDLDLEVPRNGQTWTSIQALRGGNRVVRPTDRRDAQIDHDAKILLDATSDRHTSNAIPSKPRKARNWASERDGTRASQQETLMTGQLLADSVSFTVVVPPVASSR